jgi:hypothetical protein
MAVRPSDAPVSFFTEVETQIAAFDWIQVRLQTCG